MALEMELEHGGNIFAVARERGWDWREVLDFSASINPLGYAACVRAAICGALDRIGHYPEREPVRLRRALAALWGIGEEQILLGNGATELIFFAARAFGGRDVTLALPVFSEFHRAFPKARTTSLADSSQWPDSGLLVLTRPANPTGCTLDLDSLRDRQSPVLIDESFLEFSGKPSAATLTDSHPLFVLRSLTKFYALPGLRIGALIGSADAVRSWRQLREPWQVNVLAEEAALAALMDTEHAAQSIEFVRSERIWLHAQLQSIQGVQPVESDVNFIYIGLPYPAHPLSEFLLRHKILIRNCTGWPGLAGEAIRIAVRPREENERLLECWRKFKCA